MAFRGKRGSSLGGSGCLLVVFALPFLGPLFAVVPILWLVSEVRALLHRRPTSGRAIPPSEAARLAALVRDQRAILVRLAALEREAQESEFRKRDDGRYDQRKQGARELNEQVAAAEDLFRANQEVIDAARQLLEKRWAAWSAAHASAWRHRVAMVATIGAAVALPERTEGLWDAFLRIGSSFDDGRLQFWGLPGVTIAALPFLAVWLPGVACGHLVGRLLVRVPASATFEHELAEHAPAATDPGPPQR